MSFDYYINIGLRKTNQDYVRVNPKKKIAVIGDGMSKQVRGDMASLLGVETAFAYLHLGINHGFNGVKKDIPSDLLPYFLLWNAGVLANKAVWSFNRANNIDSGSTLEAMLVIDDTVFLCHMGDSRVYHFRNGILRQVTKNHYCNTWITKKDGTMEFAGGITCSLGEVTARADVLSWQLKREDVILMCTDGLSNEVSDRKLAGIIKEGKNTGEIKKLIEDDCGGKTLDNCTFVVYKHDYQDQQDYQHKPDFDRLRTYLKEN